MPMKNLYYLRLLLSLLLLSSIAFSQEQTVAGNWQGTLSIQSTNLRIVFRISKDDRGMRAKMDSPDQGAKDIPCDSVIINGTNVVIDMKSIGGAYAGTLTNDTTIDGKWTQGGMSLPLVLNRTDKPSEIRRPQEPQPPYPYNEEEVSYVNAAAGDTLAGTLTTPKSGGPLAAVLLITGSGPQNRNEALMGHKPFLVLADYLTRQGIAVLRVDDRGIGKSTGNFAAATTEDFASDALAGVQYLKTRKEINPGKIGLIGHSEGGIIAPMVAAESKDVAFIVLMAGTGVTGEKISLLQSELINKANGIADETIKKESRMNLNIFNVVKQERDTAIVAKKIKALIENTRKFMTDKEKQDLGLVDAAIPQIIKSVNSPWFRFFLSYDPQTALKQIDCPVLAINGEKDLQVPFDQNLPKIEEALKNGNNTHRTIKKLPGLNHLFQACESGSPAEYAKIEETISPLALKTMGDWILGIVK
jgi:pimeloyl-ACP methyl ester carboxylesterase